MIDALWTMAAGFFKSRERERDELIAALDAEDKPVYARPIVRHHQPWPGGGQGPTHQPWPFQRWPGGGR